MRRALVFVMLGLFVLPALATAGYLVSDELKQCKEIPGPTIGIAGWHYAETCPDGYTVVIPEVPWWKKMLDLLDSLFGLKSIVVWLPSAGQIAFISSLVLLIRRIGQLPILGGLLERYTHGLWTILVSTIVSFWVTIEPQLGNGLTAYELIGALLVSVLGAAGFWELLKRLVRKNA